MVSYRVGEIHLPARPGAARGEKHLYHPSDGSRGGLDPASPLRGGCAPESGGEGWARLKGCSKGKESFLQLSARSSGAVVAAFLQVNNPDYPKSEDLCPNSKSALSTLPLISRLWLGPFQVGVVADLNMLFLCILDHHRLSCWWASSYLKAARRFLAGERFSLSLRNVSDGEL